jgi:hypothetical protein
MMDAIISAEFSVGEEDAPPNTLDLEIDVTFLKKRFTSLHLQEPSVKHLEKAELELNQPNPTAYTLRRYQIALVAAVAGVPREVVLELKESELTRAFDFLAELRERATRTTGAT